MTDEEYIKMRKEEKEHLYLEEIVRQLAGPIHPDTRQFFLDNHNLYSQADFHEQGFMEGFLAGIRYMENR